MELLFESRINLSEATGRLIFVQHQPSVYHEPVIRPDTFADRYGALIYGSVLKEEDRYRMWYQSIPEGWDLASDMASVAYAESVDGFSWEKPALPYVRTPDGCQSNLSSLRLHCPSVFKDPDSPASHRYRAVGFAHSGLFMAPEGISGEGYFTAHSPDGYDWKLDSTTPRWYSGDVVTSVYHPQQKRAIIALKYCARVQRIDRRCIHTAEFRNGEWSEPVSALYPDEYDDIAAMSRGYASSDYYGMGMMPSGSGTVGFLWSYWHTLPYFGKHQCALYGKSDVTLVYQAEPGGKWFHMPGRPSFLDHRSEPWMSGWIDTAANTVRRGEEDLLFFTGTPFEHGFNLTPEWKKHPRWAEYMIKHCERVIGVASWPVGRLFGIEATCDGSITVSLGVQTEPFYFLLNYKASFGGGVRVEVVDSEDRTLETAVPMEGDKLAERAEWKGGALITPNANGPTKVRLHLIFSTVYAYKIETVAQVDIR